MVSGNKPPGFKSKHATSLVVEQASVFILPINKISNDDIVPNQRVGSWTNENIYKTFTTFRTVKHYCNWTDNFIRFCVTIRWNI